MPLKTPRLSLPLLLVLPSILATLLAVGLSSYHSFHSGQKAVKDLILRWQKERALRIAEDLQKNLEIPTAIARETALEFREGRSNTRQPQALIARFQHQRSLFQAMQGAAIYVGTTQGQIIGSKPPAQLPTEDPRQQSWYRRAVVTRQPIWGESETGANARDRKLVVSQALYDPSGKLQGAIAIDYSLSQLDRLLEDRKIGKSGQVLLFDRALRPLATSTPNAALETALQERIHQQFGSPEAIRDLQQFPLKIGARSQWVCLFPFVGDNHPRWWIAIITAEDDFLAPLQASTRHNILLSLALSLAAAAIAAAATRQLARPLQRLREATLQIASGDWGQRIELNRSDEIGDLAHSFNSMAEQLQTAFAELQALNQVILDSENRLLQFLEVLPVGVSVHDSTGKPLYINQVARDLWEVDPVEMQTIAQTLETCQIYLAGTSQLYPSDRFPVARSLQGERVNVEDIELRRGNCIIPLEMRSAPIVTPTGEVAYALATFLDISERKRAEQVLLHYNRSLEQRVAERTAALVKAEAELKSLFAAMQEVVLVLDKGGRYQQVISKREEHLVKSRSELLHRTLHEVFPAEQAERFLQALQEVITTQETLKIEYQLEIDRRTLWFEASISPFLEDTVVWVARDVSDRQVLEDKVRTSEAKMRAILEAMPDIILTIDERQDIEVSPTNLSHLDSSDLNLLDLTVEQFWSDENGDLWFSLVRRARERQEVLNFDYCLQGRSGTQVWFSAQIAPLPNQSALWVARDISARKAAEAAILEAKEAAEAANRAKSTFVANMSHELRSPLNAILGFAQLLARTPELPPERREYAKIITHSGEHLLGLIDQVLNLSKIEAGRAQLYEIDFELERFLSDLEDLFALKAEEKGLHFSIERAANLPQFLRGDRLKLRQIAINLLGNSLKFTRSGSVILHVSALERRSGERQWIRWEVEDTGPGIDADEFHYLFESFQQTRTGQQLQEGTGIGLSIAREFVQIMGGSITVRSRGYTYNPDAPAPAPTATESATHTAFTVTLPLLPIESVESEESPHPRRPIALAPHQPQYRILVADDRDYNRQLLVQLIAPLGFEVREASNGQEAIAVWETWQPHLIWMDLRMPVLDGYAASRYIKSHLRDVPTTIVALTASPLEEESAELRLAGCDDCARKPVRETAIFEAMARHLGVRYIDEEAKTTSERGQSIDSSLSLCLEAMPSEWVQQLERAAASIDDEQIFALLSEIPPDLALLARTLGDWVRTFRCDKIVALLSRYDFQENDR